MSYQLHEGQGNQATARPFFILGAADPEMNEISKELAARDWPFAWAARHERKCSWGEAYRATSLCDDWDRAPRVLPQPGQPVIWVECGGDILEARFGAPAARSDHHRPGDPGFGAPSMYAWPASSLAQVLSLVDGIAGYEFADGAWWALSALGGAPTRVPEHLVMIGAADHNLTAAFGGQCLGVDPAAVMRFRDAMYTKKKGGQSAEEVSALVASAAQLICAAEEMAPGIKDLRLAGKIPLLSEAAARLGVAVLSESLELHPATKRPTGRRKWCIFGAATPAPITWFLEELVPQAGLAEAYGDPARGFAGAYLPEAA